eukprot:COSAG01_NODE_769_length_13735_cov_41.389410_8_plen_61_part_00
MLHVWAAPWCWQMGWERKQSLRLACLPSCLQKVGQRRRSKRELAQPPTPTLAKIHGSYAG